MSTASEINDVSIRLNDVRAKVLDKFDLVDIRIEKLEEKIGQEIQRTDNRIEILIEQGINICGHLSRLDEKIDQLKEESYLEAANAASADRDMSGATRGLGLRIAKLEKAAEEEPEPEERPCPPGMPGCPAYNDPGPVLTCEDCHDMYDKPEPKPEQGHLTEGEITDAYDQAGDTSLDGLYGVAIAALDTAMEEWRMNNGSVLAEIIRKHREAYKKDLNNV